jgi:hypothetical protein
VLAVGCVDGLIVFVVVIGGDAAYHASHGATRVEELMSQ